MKVNVLGTDYEISIKTEEQDSMLHNLYGYCDVSTKKIVILDYSVFKDDKSMGDLKELHRQTLRHELIHAFLYESGLRGSSHNCECWAINEEMVDWIAIQFPKLMKTFKEVDCL